MTIALQERAGGGKQELILREAELIVDRASPPTAANGRGVVLGTGGELLVQALAVPGMAVRITTAGTVFNHRGQRTDGATSASIAIAAADPANTRFDIVVLRPDGTYAVRQGTPDPAPADPALTAGDVPLARVTVAALDATVDPADIADLRERATLAATAGGRALMGDGFFTAAMLGAGAGGKFAASAIDTAAALHLFALNSLTNAWLLQAIPNGAFQADAGTRALFADGIWTDAKLASVYIFADGTRALTGDWALGGFDVTGFDELGLNDAAANASATGRIRRNAAILTWHDGTAARQLVGGDANLTANGLVYGTAAARVVSLGAATDGQIPIGSTGAAPVLGSLAAPAAGLTIVGGAGTITFALANDLAALEALAGNGLAARTGADTWAQRSIVAPAAGIAIANGDGAAGNPTLSLANDLLALEGLAGTGLAVRSAADTWVQRSLVAPAAGFTVTDGDGVLGNPTFVLANDLAALEAVAASGFVTRTAADTWLPRTLTAPAAGFTITNPAGVLGDPTFVLANDLGALEALAGSGYAVRTGADTWAQRSIADAGGGRITVVAGDGVAGNTTIDVALAAAFAWTAAHTWTVAAAADAVVLDVAQPGIGLFNDSPLLRWRSRSTEAGPTNHTTDWQAFSDALDAPGASVWRLQSRIDGAGFADRMAVSDDGSLLIPGAINHDGATIGFFGTAPATQATVYTQTFATADKTHATRTAADLVNNAGGAATDGTVDAIADPADAPGTADILRDDLVLNTIPALRNALREVIEMVNKVRVDQVDTASIVNSLIDDLQLYGLVL